MFPTIERRFWRSVAVAATGVLAAGLLAAPPAGADTAGPVLGRNFPDPDVVRVGRTYHAYATNGEAANIQHATSTDLVHWSPAETDPLPRLGDWAEPTRSLVWAPEVFANGHGFTMHYTARDRASGKQCIGVALSSSPDGPFLPTGKGPLVCPAEQGAPSTPRAIRRTADVVPALEERRELLRAGHPDLPAAGLLGRNPYDGRARRFDRAGPRMGGETCRGPDPRAA